MRILQTLLCVWLCWFTLSCRTTPTPTATRPPAELPATLRDSQFLYEVIRYVYRWHFDDRHFVMPEPDATVALWVRTVPVERDAGDRSDFAQLWIPGAKLAVELKRADYTVPELKLAVNEAQYRIERVTHLETPPAAPSTFTVLHLPVKELLDFLMRTRSERIAPTPEQRRHVREAILGYLEKNVTNVVTAPQIFFVAPLSPVANDVWIFWENGRLMFHLAADFGITDAAFWKNSALNLRVIDLETAVVATQEQVPGSNAFVTRDWMGRVLFNCVVLGERIDLPAQTVNEWLRDPSLR